eukprot:scaffold318459_cov31-Tisochrysis_lutea.AAC.2
MPSSRLARWKSARGGRTPHATYQRPGKRAVRRRSSQGQVAPPVCACVLGWMPPPVQRPPWRRLQVQRHRRPAQVSSWKPHRSLLPPQQGAQAPVLSC